MRDREATRQRVLDALSWCHTFAARDPLWASVEEIRAATRIGSERLSSRVVREILLELASTGQVERSQVNQSSKGVRWRRLEPVALAAK